MKVAFIGLGNMGLGMAANILKAGFDLAVWNRSPAKADQLIEQGARLAPTAKDAAVGADVIITSLMDDDSIRQVLNGPDGILSGMDAEAIHICVTTISPKFGDELMSIHEKHGSKFICCPVLGRPDAAAEGNLIGVLGGKEEDIKKVDPVLSAFTMMTQFVGEKPSQAAMLKLCANYAVISTIELMGEIYACAEKAGVDADKIALVFQFMFASPIFQMYSDKIRSRDFEDGGFRMTGGLKDVRLMLDAAKTAGAHFDIAQIIEGKMLEGIDKGMQDSDWSGIYEISRQRAQLS